MKAKTAYTLSKKYKNPSNLKQLLVEIKTAVKLGYFSLALEFEYKPKVKKKLEDLGFYVHYLNKDTLYICWDQNDKM